MAGDSDDGSTPLSPGPVQALEVSGSSNQEANEEGLSWRVRGFDTDPSKASVLAVVVFLAFGLGILVTQRILIGLLGSAMILAATAEFWLGTVYRLDEEGASSRTGLSASRVLWKDVKRAVITSVGIKLSPLEDTTRLAPFRGIFLRYGKEDRVRIEGVVRKLGGSDVRYVEGAAD